MKRKVKICDKCGSVNNHKDKLCASCNASIPKTYKVNKSITNEKLNEIISFRYWFEDFNKEHSINIGNEYVVSRNSGIDIFDNVYISNHHAYLFVENNVLYIKDLDSTNGTEINNEILTANQLYKMDSGDMIKFANVELKLCKEVVLNYEG